MHVDVDLFGVHLEIQYGHRIAPFGDGASIRLADRAGDDPIPQKPTVHKGIETRPARPVQLGLA
jgi:hypothetical protein